MLRLNYHPPGTPPGTLEFQHPPPPGPSRISLIQYDAACFREEELPEGVKGVRVLGSLLRPGFTTWINFEGLGDREALRALGAELGLHPLELEDVVKMTQRPKVEVYDDHLFIVAEMIYPEEGGRRLTFEQVSLFVWERTILMVQECREGDIFGRVRERLRSGRGRIRSQGADYLAYALLDALTDQFFPVLEAAGARLEQIEEQLLTSPQPQSVRGLHEVKRLLLQLRRSCWPLREILSSLMRDESGIVQAPTRLYLRDSYDHAVQILEIIESARDLAAGLMELYVSNLSLRTNDIMRVLTVVSTFFIPLTFLAGVYGMNFNTESPWNMPELNWRYGYVFFWVASLAIAGLTFYIVKRKRWL